MTRAHASLAAGVLLAFAALLPASAQADPESDRLTVRRGFEKRFPGIPFDDYVLGGFMLNPDGRRHYEDIMAFPPFEVEVDRGKAMWETPLRDGSSGQREQQEHDRERPHAGASKQPACQREGGLFAARAVRLARAVLGAREKNTRARARLIR